MTPLRNLFVVFQFAGFAQQLSNSWAYRCAWDVHNGWSKSFDTKCLFIFDPLESIFDESESTHQKHNFVLFQNMDLEILCRFLFESSELIFDRPKTFVWTEIFFHIFLYFHFCDPKLKVGTFVVIPACRTKCTIWAIFVFPKSWFLIEKRFTWKEILGKSYSLVRYQIF